MSQGKKIVQCKTIHNAKKLGNINTIPNWNIKESTIQCIYKEEKCSMHLNVFGWKFLENHAQ